MLKIEIDDDGYQLIGPKGEESGVTDYDDTAEVECEDGLYFTTIGDPDEADEAIIYHMVDGRPEVVPEDHEVEEVEFILEEEDEGDGDDVVA